MTKKTIEQQLAMAEVLTQLRYLEWNNPIMNSAFHRTPPIEQNSIKISPFNNL